MFGEDFEILISGSFHPVVSARASLLEMFLVGKSGYGLKLSAFANIFRNQVMGLSLSLLRLYMDNGQHACNTHLYHSYGSFLIARGHFRRKGFAALASQAKTKLHSVLDRIKVDGITPESL
jgi:hypothetical protein